MNVPVRNDQASNWVRFAPGNPVLKGVNWGGLKTLYIKEVRRFFKVQMQTVWAPAITTLLYLAIFTVALGRGGRTVPGTVVPYATFIAPGLIVMAMMQNAFANASFSLLVGKIQGNIVDYLMPPLSTGELICALIGAAVTRLPGRIRGVAGDAAVAGSFGRSPSARAGVVVRPDGGAAAVVPWAADVALG
jgi:ABC-2 type transport system permease protein